MNRVIAIDGPSGAGKSTIARAVGKMLGFLHVDSGALYRIVTWQALLKGVDCNDGDAVAAFVAELEVEMRVAEGAVRFAVAGVEPGDAIRTAEINAAVSPVSKVPEVRTKVTRWLREMRTLGNLVVEGRDIGSVVYPDSPARFYLDASPEERARRRHLEEQTKGIAQLDRQAVMASLLNRDRIDSTRAVAPLRVADGAQVIDSTRMPINEVLEAVIAHLPADWLGPRT
jgi:cytidylate kinase